MFLNTLKTVLALAFYLAIAYALSLRILGGLTLKAQLDAEAGKKSVIITEAAIIIAIFNLIGLPPLPIFWPKSALIAVVATTMSPAHFFIFLLFTNLTIFVYSVMWLRNFEVSLPHNLNRKELNIFILEHIVMLLLLTVTAPHWLAAIL